MGDPYLPEKTKYFTRVIYKESVLVSIQVAQHQIRGYLHVRPDDRIIDELDRGGKFVAVTEAVVFDAAGNIIAENEFMVVNREHILWVIPVADSGETSDKEAAR